jgi:hypothetical protein
VNAVDAQGRAPDWDLEQLEVILAPASDWQLVIAGPGAGKSAVACQRIAYLIDEGVPASRILLVSFTRTAVAELRDRIVSYAVAGERARSVRISTIDSHAWSLRSGVDDEPLPASLSSDTYDHSIKRTVEFLRAKQPDLLEFIGRFEHLILDEAQDVTGIRSDLVIEILKNLATECGVTILADPAQSIYGFTTDSCDQNATETLLLDRLGAECPRPLVQRALKNVHRIKGTGLTELFLRTRKEIELAENARGHVARVRKIIRDTCGTNVGVETHESLAQFLTGATDPSMLVLFRRRADVLFASSYCSVVGVEHRLRMSGLPVVVRPWIGWLLGEVVQGFLLREEFDRLWEIRASIASAPFIGEERDACWSLLHRLCAGSRPNALDLVLLRGIVARSRPPIELCFPEVGCKGPILGTIHASKGREADSVVLVMSHQTQEDAVVTDTASAAEFEEARVYYVGATRARKMLAVAGSSAVGVGYLDSRRIYRNYGEARAQLEVGRDGDIDKVAHLCWPTRLATQQALAERVGRAAPVNAQAIAEQDYARRLILEDKGLDGVTRYIDVGQLSKGFQIDLGKLWGKLDANKRLKPAEMIRHLYLVAVGTVGLSEQERNAVKGPYDRSALALVPVVKGFPMIQFLYRKGNRRSQ